MFKKIIFCCGLSFLFGSAMGQVPVHINSGNPNFPFPQFLDYASDRQTLASHNPIGVPHVEMEQHIRDAWQIFANSFVYTADVVSGVKYIQANIGCPYDCIEGDGYALLGAAYMADKTTFDGLWMRTHDIRTAKYPRYKDGVIPKADYLYGDNVLLDMTDGASDGSFDVAMALLMAWKQWGDNMGIVDYQGNLITYKSEAIKAIRGLVQKKNLGRGDCRSVSGSIGFDGYVKNGNTWSELTNWASNASPDCPDFAGSNFMYVDYMSPSYFKAFAQVLEAENADAWEISQFKRGEASSDWLMGKFLDDPAAIPFAGKVSLNATGLTPTFSSFSDGEDFRTSWRTMLNYVWHGNPSYSWNPSTHQVVNTPNTYERDIALRYAQFLKNPQSAPWSNNCQPDYSGLGLSTKGPSTLPYYMTTTGKFNSTFTLNWIQGAASPAAVAAQEYELMAKMYRQCVIEWEVTSSGDGYLSSVPRYFHGWFRLLGMLVLTGNAHTPLNMLPKANLKVYHKVDKTVASPGEVVTHTLTYRNYGSLDATGSVLKLSVPAGYELIQATKGGSVNGDSVVWNIGTVKGFKTGALSSTLDSVKVTFAVKPNASGRLISKARISSQNALSSYSNEYPNNQTAVMERNAVDIVTTGLQIQKTTPKKTYEVGDTVIYTLKFKNTTSNSLLNGGRAGVNFSYAKTDFSSPTSTNQSDIKVRLFHDADEPYIDYGNYRLSYFINDPTFRCYTGTTGCTNGWSLSNTIAEGLNKDLVKVFQENITSGSDTGGAWNQRLVIQFSPQLATTTQHLNQYMGIPNRIHQGGREPLRAVWRLNTTNFNNVNWADDRSWQANTNSDDGGLYFPIGKNFTNPNLTGGSSVTSWHESACTTSSQTVQKVMIEEWDGSTWRRVFGEGPALNKEARNVVISDTLPTELVFKSFIRQNALGVNATVVSTSKGTALTWSSPTLGINQTDSIVYKAVISACPPTGNVLPSKIWIKADNSRTVSSVSQISSSCMTTLLPHEADAQQAFTVYPNPAKDQVTIQMGINTKEMAVSLKDVKGHVVYHYQGESKKVLDVSGLASGVYLIEISTDASVYRSKLVVVK